MVVTEHEMKYGFLKTEPGDFYCVKYVGDKYVVAFMFGNLILQRGEVMFTKDEVIKYHNLMTKEDMEELRNGKYYNKN